MKGFFGAIILGVALILAAAIIAGAISFPDAIGLILNVILWIIIAIVIMVIVFFVGVAIWLKVME